MTSQQNGGGTVVAPGARSKQARNAIKPSYDVKTVEETMNRVVLRVKVPSRGRFALALFLGVPWGIAGGTLLLGGLSKGEMTAIQWGVGLCVSLWFFVRLMRRPKTLHITIEPDSISVGRKTFAMEHVSWIGTSELVIGGTLDFVDGNKVVMTYGSRTVVIAGLEDVATAIMLRDKIIAAFNKFGWAFKPG